MRSPGGDLAPGAAAGPSRDIERGWIESKGFDLALFTLSPLAGLAVALAALNLSWGSTVLVGATFLVAIPHYMSSFTFFLGDDNLPYYRSRWAVFFAGPAAILLAVAALRVTGNGAPVQITMFVWNIYHVARQSSGILALYRRLNRGDRGEHVPAQYAILGVNAAMAFWYIERYPPLFNALSAIHPALSQWPRVIAAVTGGVALVMLWARIRRRTRPFTLAESAFLLSSLLLFHPYLWVQDAELATFAMLMGHFIQYLAIVWLLNRRKYAGVPGSRHQRVLSWFSRDIRTVALAIVAIGTTFYVFDRATALVGAQMVYVTLWNAMTLMHFYVDGLVWAFRQPHVQSTVGVYLTPDTRIVR